MKLIATILAVQAMIIHNSFQVAIPCSIEYVYGSTIDSQRTVYVWSTEINNGIYSSLPLCLDVNYNIITRRCQDGFWYPKYVDNCYNFECPKYFIGFNQDKCYYQFASGDACPDLHSILARIQHGSHSNETAPYTSVSCPYDIQEFLNTSLTTANRISVLFSFLKKLHLTVNFPEVLAAGDDKAIRCYSSIVDMKLKINRKAVGLKKLFQTNYSDRSKNYIVFKVDIADDPAEYWCHIYETGQVRPITTQRVLAYKKRLGNEYSLRVAVQGNNGLNLTEKLCQTCRLIEVSSFATKLTEYVLHFTAEAADDVLAQFSTLKADLEARVENFETVEIISFKSSEFCLPQNGTWDLTLIGSMAFPLVVCLDSNENPIGRKCSGNFLYGADWEEEKPCSKKAQLSEATRLLSNIISRGNVDFRALANAMSALDNCTSVDVALAADGFKRAQVNSTLDFLRAISKIMGLDRKVLETSQKNYNAMAKILDKIDEVLIENPTPIKPVMEENLSVITMRPFKDDVVGTAFYKHNRVRQILRNQTLQDLPLENLEAVVLTPHDLLEALTKNLSREKKEDFQVVLTTFKNDDLFPGAKGGSGRIINVAIPGFKTYWCAPTETFLRPKAPTREIDYGFWDYERGMFNTERIYSGFAHSPNFAVVNPVYQPGIRSIGPRMMHNPHLNMILVMKLIFLWDFFEHLI